MDIQEVVEVTGEFPPLDKIPPPIATSTPVSQSQDAIITIDVNTAPPINRRLTATKSLTSLSTVVLAPNQAWVRHGLLKHQIIN